MIHNIHSYRAWYKAAQQMCNVLAIQLAEQVVVIEFTDKGKRMFRNCRLDEVVLTIGCGLRDKNGIEIFQDDIIKTDGVEPFGLVVWHSGGLKIKYSDSPVYYLFNGEGLSSMYEVVDNLYTATVHSTSEST